MGGGWVVDTFLMGGSLSSAHVVYAYFHTTLGLGRLPNGQRKKRTKFGWRLHFLLV